MQAPTPSGQFIAAGYSERVTIPQPALPPANVNVQVNCPHDDVGLVDWFSLGLPTTGDIKLPAGTRVVLTTSLASAIGTLTIPASSELILAPPLGGTGLEMALGGMIVMGTLTAGSETCRLQDSQPVTLTFTGTRPVDAVANPPDEHVKGIDVDGGTLSLHGKRFYKTWTRLSQTVEPGDTILYLQDDVNWQVGQQVVLVTTALRDSRDWHQNEILTITAIASSNGATGSVLTVSPSVQDRHVANDSYQAEVGLLTRTIKIQGSDTDSEPTDIDPLNCVGTSSERWRRYGDSSQPCTNLEITGYGAHVIVRNGGLGFVEGVELYRVGQTNVMGRYPMHFHLLGNCPSCYLKDSSIHRSYFRCISIHATNQATVAENVAYDGT